jgi:hypothetical protein
MTTEKSVATNMHEGRADQILTEELSFRDHAIKEPCVPLTQMQAGGILLSGARHPAALRVATVRVTAAANGSRTAAGRQVSKGGAHTLKLTVTN